MGISSHFSLIFAHFPQPYPATTLHNSHPARHAPPFPPFPPISPIFPDPIILVSRDGGFGGGQRESRVSHVVGWDPSPHGPACCNGLLQCSPGVVRKAPPQPLPVPRAFGAGSPAPAVVMRVTMSRHHLKRRTRTHTRKYQLAYSFSLDGAPDLPPASGRSDVIKSVVVLLCCFVVLCYCVIVLLCCVVVLL